MFKTKQRYYLHQMDVTLWEPKNTHVDWMIIIDTPELSSDKSTQLFDAMIQSIGKARSDICVVNILKSQSADNQALLLKQQIGQVLPKVILVLGQHATQFLLNIDSPIESIDELRGKSHYYGEKKTPVLVSYHPEDLLKNPLNKSKAFADLLRFNQSR